MPLTRTPEQSLGFRPPEQPAQPPTWWTGPHAEDIPGGGFTNPSILHSWWRNFADPDDGFVVQLVAEDHIVGDRVRRNGTRLESRVKNDVLDSAQARKMAAALTEAADLLDT